MLKVFKEHNIPKELEKELDLSDLDGEKNPLRVIYDKISDRLEYFASILEDLIQPNTSLASMQEVSGFSEEDKKIVLKIFKRIMKLHRHGLQTNVSGNDDEFIEFINTFWEQWPRMKIDLKLILNKMEKSWEGDNFIKVELGYLG